ncbi:uncharacterized protein KY384_006993 [Bacidia gigantensis]|uniref:uncharacterized protein n=1 Tax=Bacidia gigantensis TaxID=2732470 RepID=UPI001D059A93|nr:uncharacterized protein KY384_006993 [Bacidia gigantensis]KAG8528077.1 hypothetical protein KY384_006993 [Bacidia gigantensis]
MGNSSSSHKISAQDRAILDMKTQRDKLRQYQKRINTITQRETDIARSCLERGDKEKALLALRRKKFQQSLLAKADSQLATLEQLTANVEFALVQKDVLFGLQQGTSALKQIHSDMGGIENVDKLMGENEEAIGYQKRISEMLEGRLSTEEEEDVEEELVRLEAGVLMPDTEGVLEEVITTPAELPNAPRNEPIFKEELKDKARRQAMIRERRVAEALEPMAA